MDLNMDIKDLKEQVQKLLGKLPGSPNTAQEGESSHVTNEKPTSKPKKSNAETYQQMLKPLTDVLGKASLENEKILGVDITPHYIRVAQMKHSYGQWILNNLASSCMETQFKKDDIAINVDLYVENLKDLVTKHKISTKNVAFSLPTSSSIVKVLTVPEMDEDDF